MTATVPRLADLIPAPGESPTMPVPAPAVSRTDLVLLRAVAAGHVVVARDVLNCPRHVERLAIVGPDGSAVDVAPVIGACVHALQSDGLIEPGRGGASPWYGGTAHGYRLRLTDTGQQTLEAIGRPINATGPTGRIVLPRGDGA